VSEPPADAETFLAVTDSVAALQPGLSTLEAGVLAALHLDLAQDSRSFAKIFGVEHALVLRAVETLVGEAAFLTVIERVPRTQRTRYAVTETGRAVLDHLHG
jgi:phage regulator Rha-like protein